MRPGSGTDVERRYAGTLAGLWERLSQALSALDALAADPSRLDETVLDRLPRLQYELHWASERLAGLELPTGHETLHAELSAALVDARDATAEMVEAIELGGPEAAARLVHEWRGALFRVRLARVRMRLGSPGQAARAARGNSTLATFAVWSLWAVTGLLLLAALVAYRP